MFGKGSVGAAAQLKRKAVKIDNTNALTVSSLNKY
jgi:hypothetical protein